MGSVRMGVNPKLPKSQEQALKVAGIQRDLDLAAECATFYILEDLWNDMFEWDGDTRWSKGDRLPDEGWGSRLEMRAMQVRAELDARTSRLARTLARYLVLACGGELRHWSRIRRTTSFYEVPRTGRGARKVQKALDAMDWQTARDLCKNEDPTPPTVRKMFDMMEASRMANDFGGASWRGLAWEKWLHLVERDPAQAMYECAWVFEHIAWVNLLHGASQSFYWADDPTASPVTQRPDNMSYGGLKWAVPARLCADFFAGKLQPRTFIDRCWSIQHNGGSLFDKAFRVQALDVVLRIQAADHGYHTLNYFAEPGIRQLWIEHRGWDQAAPLVSGVLGWTPGPRTSQLTMSDLYMLCIGCGGYYEETGLYSPCLSGNGRPIVPLTPDSNYCGLTMDYGKKLATEKTEYLAAKLAKQVKQIDYMVKLGEGLIPEEDPEPAKKGCGNEDCVECYPDEDETCSECGHPYDDCSYCSNCGSHMCECCMYCGEHDCKIPEHHE